MRAPGMPLGELLRPWVAAPPTAVSDIALDSRACAPGSLFMAVAGGDRHGLAFIDEVIAGGVAAVAWEPVDAGEPEAVARCRRRGIATVAVPRLGARASAIAGRWFAEPSADLCVAAVTGTDGKTSVTQFIAAALDRPDHRCGSVGTLGWGFPGELAEGTLTTPDAVSLQRCLAGLRDRGARAAAIEISSHALAQHRTAGVRIGVAVLTQVGRDHLDYHGSEAAYRAARRRLFDRDDVPARVVNLDDSLGREIAAAYPQTSVTYSAAGDHAADLCLTAYRPEPDGMALTVSVGGTPATLRLPLVGRFNAANVLAALGTLLATGSSPEAAFERIAALRPVPGRMERFLAPGRPAVILDYAHTAGALAAALAAAREHCTGRLWVVFGCGGERDRGKRPLMGEVATAGADRIVLTNDNPRGEAPERIIDEIRAGCDGAADVRVELDREAAIASAFKDAAPDDLIVVAGKGHETTQTIGERVLHYSDHETVRLLLRGEP